jgi:hypothetical protein
LSEESLTAESLRWSSTAAILKVQTKKLRPSSRFE